MPQSMKSSIPSEKTASKDDLRRLANTLFNPFAREDIIVPANSTPTSRALIHAGGLSIGYGGLFFVLRKMINAGQKAARNKDQATLVAYSKAKYPTLSFDPSVRDEASEKKEEKQAITSLQRIQGFGDTAPELTEEVSEKTANKDEKKGASAPTAHEETTPGLSELMLREMEGGHSTAHFALAASAAILGGSGGWRVAEYINDKNRRKELDQRLRKTKNYVDKMVFDEFVRKRNLQGALPETASMEEKAANISPEDVRAGGRDTLQTQATPASNTPESPGLGTVAAQAAMHPIDKGFRGAEVMFWLWTAAALALSYKAGKHYGDKNDPNRAKLSALQEVAKKRAIVNEAPVLMNASALEEMEEAALKGGTVRRKPAAVKALHGVQAGEQSTSAPRLTLADVGRTTTPAQRSRLENAAMLADPKDPYADLLTPTSGLAH